MTRPAFLSAAKADPLNFKIFPDQRIEIDASNENIPTEATGIGAFDLERAAKFIENFERKEGDLSFVIRFVIEIAIPPQTASSHAFNGWDFNRWEVVGLAAMVSFKIMAGRDVKMTDFHRANDIIGLKRMKADGIGPGQIIRRRSDGSLEYQHDELTIEEPLEIRIVDQTVATTMRTPGHDDELAAGFLVTEAIVRAPGDIERISTDENVSTVRLRAGMKAKLSSAQRFGTISTSCGLCGKQSIDAIRQNFFPIEAQTFRINIATLLSLPQLLRDQQSDFARTGGIHAAGIFDPTGKPLIVREDIGRHNAVDKAIGRAFLDGGLPLDRHILLVSGRASFEILQKALAAGIPIIASVSAPSSLAMEFARENNQTLVGFLRPPSFNIYSHVERVILDL